METVSQSARKEILAAVRVRYGQASRLEKGKILGEFAAVAGYHRKHAIRLLNPRTEGGVKTVLEGARIYGAAVKAALVLLWETADRICGKRLKAAIPHLVVALERHGHLKLDAEVRKQVLRVSAATIDRMLTAERKGSGSRRNRRLPKKLRKEIPIKTFADWKDPLHGFLENDFVVHGGGSMAGEYLHRLVATDVCSGWVEAVPLLAREQTLAVAGLIRIREQMPVTTLGIDSDNDGAFINETVASYCQTEGLAFTRSRPHHKNDQSWIEQKNGAVIRRMVGPERFSGIVAGQALAQLLAALSTGNPSEGPDRKGLDHFLASLPELWREGEARPTHRKGEAKARHWRTREDPFKDVWTDILLWLQKEPDTIAKLILQKLDEKYPGQFDQKLLRTLQRRVGEWRRTMARRLVFGGVAERHEVQAVAATASVAG